MNNRQQSIIIIILGSLIALSPFSIDMYLPAFPAIAAALHTDTAQIGYSLTSYYAGLCIGQLVYGILIDKYGRKKPLIIGLIIYTIAAGGCAIAFDVHTLIATRLLMALGGCVGMVAARAIVRDLFLPEDTAKILSTLVLVMGVAPIIAPTIGGLVSGAFGWRWVFVVMGLIAVAILIAVAAFLPETKTADASISLKIKAIIPDYIAVLKNRFFLIYALAGGISYAGMYAYITGSPFVFMEKFGFSETGYGWAFAFNACGLILGSQLNRLALKYYDSAKLTLFAAVLLFITGFLLLFISAYGSAPHPFMILGCTFLFLFWLGIINPNATALSLKPFNVAAGRASALLGSLQMIAGVIASWLVSFFNNGTIVIMPVVMFACTILTLGLLLIVCKPPKINYLTT